VSFTESLLPFEMGELVHLGMPSRAGLFSALYLRGVSPNCHTRGKVAAGKAIEDSCDAKSLTL
jgi:hypothetical protein